jgi:2-oxoglutarate ferredoxin oxidoreductase subunit beta
VARYSVYHIRPLIKTIKKALKHKGFAFVEVLSICPTQYGRRNEMPNPAAMLLHFKESCVTLSQAKGMALEELRGKILIGEFIGG